MKVIDFHLDDLLDREIEGTLSPEEDRRLREHLERCMQCHLERQLRSDFEEELGAREDPTTIQMFVSGAMRAAHPLASRRVPRAASSHAWRRRFILLLAATMVFGAGLAGAEVEFAGRAWVAARQSVAFWFQRSRPEPTPGDAMTVSAKTTSENAPPVVHSPAVALPALPPDLDDANVRSQASAPVRRDEPSSISPVTAGTYRPGADRPRVEMLARDHESLANPSKEQVPNEAETAKPSTSASTLFDDANAARHRGSTVEAAGLYHDLQARFPESQEGRLSIAVVARMQLDLGETTAAVSGFEAYLATGDEALREEAMAGRAIALGRLGRIVAEVDAWGDLLRAYPRSSYVGVARTRTGQDLP